MKDQALWLQLLRMSSMIRDYSGELNYVYFSDETILLNELPVSPEANSFLITLNTAIDQPNDLPIFEFNNFLKINVKNTEGFSTRKLRFLKIYLPYCFLAYQSKKLNRCITITHFAQTLDGKIATGLGDSRWIGNEENLDHAHRMRALCDGIMVGNNTVRNDQPSLTVRRVPGENPKRIIIGSSEVDLSSLMACCTDPILVVSNKANYTSTQVEHLRVASDNCRINSHALLTVLFQQGIHSVYVEGGAETTSNFLKDGAVDVLQLHISPLVFGSGKQGIVLPEIKEVTESQQFKDFDFFKVGDSVMFVGAL